jgi:predicted N-acetyltransferase YhbS
VKQNYDIIIGQQPDASAYDRLREKAFAFASVAPRGAEVLRAGGTPLPGAIAAAYQGGELIGYVALWPIHLWAPSLQENMVLLGPLMVDPAHQGCGLGSALMAAILKSADARTLPPVLLVGDEAYYRRFGFVQGLAQNWQMPGLAAPSRMLVRARHGAILPRDAAVLPAFAPPRKKQAAA